MVNFRRKLAGFKACFVEVNGYLRFSKFDGKSYVVFEECVWYRGTTGYKLFNNPHMIIPLVVRKKNTSLDLH